MNDADFKAMILNAVDKTIKQGQPSVDSSGNCVYSNMHKECCIVGHMMPNDSTRIEADSYGDSDVRSLYFDTEFEWLEQFNESQIQVLGELQDMHDEAGRYSFITNFMAATSKIPFIREHLSED